MDKPTGAKRGKKLPDTVQNYKVFDNTNFP